MHMSTLSRRTQLLLDEERHRRLADEAQRTGRSIGALVREAIDVRFEQEEQAERRRTAAGELLSAPRPGDPEPDWSEVERELLDASPAGAP
jgi:predicted DNA-binding protein